MGIALGGAFCDGVVGPVFWVASSSSYPWFVGAFIPPDPSDLTELVARFPDIHMIRFVENGLYLSALILGIPLCLALFWALRKTSLASALFGSALTIVGLIAMATLATPHVAHNSISELYRATGATPEAQATLALIWQATWGVFVAPLYVGFFVGMIGFTLIGVAMFGSLAFSKGFGWVSVVIGRAKGAELATNEEICF